MNDEFFENDASSQTPIAIISDRAGLGDGLMVCPLIWSVAERYPGRPMWWLAACNTFLVEQVHGLVADRVTNFVRLPRARYWPVEIVTALRTLPRFHRVFDVRSRFGDIALARLLLRSDKFIAGTSLTSWKRPPSIADRNFAVIEADAGRSIDWTIAAANTGFTVSDAASDLARRTFPAGPRYLAIVVSASRGKRWPTARTVELARAAIGRGMVPVYFSGPAERKEVAEILEAVPGSIAVPSRFAGDDDSVFRLDLAAASARHMTVAVATDAGLGHLLGISQVPVVSLFGPGNPERWAPQATKRIVLVAPETDGKRLTESIEVPPVMAAVETLLRQDPRLNPSSARR